MGRQQSSTALASVDQGSAALKAKEQPKTAQVRFWLKFHVDYGQSIRIIGGHESMGELRLPDQLMCNARMQQCQQRHSPYTVRTCSKVINCCASQGCWGWSASMTCLAASVPPFALARQVSASARWLAKKQPLCVCTAVKQQGNNILAVYPANCTAD